jgi:pimeloyl-ACP methyl ester carboxylesterase
MPEQFARAGAVELCYETFGDPADPALLLIMGLGTQMIAWDPAFCGQLVDCGFHVIRYDNRDIGRSTHFDSVRPPNPSEILTRRIKHPAYLLNDMADDAVGLLDALDIDRAHVVGASMGGMIAQVVAVRHPDRVRSLTSIMSTTGGRLVGQPAPRVFPFFLRRREEDPAAAAERMVKLFGVIGSPGFPRDVERLRALIRESIARSANDMAGTGRQLAAVLASGNRTRDLARITAPTLVIHGTSDRMVGKSGGRATSRAIPGARMELIEGMGHDLPPGAWPRIVDLIAEHARAADGAAEPAVVT